MSALPLRRRRIGATARRACAVRAVTLAMLAWSCAPGAAQAALPAAPRVAPPAAPPAAPQTAAPPATLRTAPLAVRLPDEQVVRAAIEHHPDVAAARAQLAGNAAQRDRLRAGDYETLIDAGTLVRRGAGYVDAPDWTLSVSRPIRLPRKAEIDARTGERLVARGAINLNDVRHELGRTLLARWFESLRQASAVAILREQVDLAGRTLDIVGKRVRAGDASRLERLQAEAAVATAQAQLGSALQRAAAAAVALQRGFPEVAAVAAAGFDAGAESAAATDPASPHSASPDPASPAPAATDPAPSDPAPPEEDAATWQQRIVQANHEIALRRAELAVREAQAERARADSVPDPSVGMHVYSDAGRRDRVIGAFVSVPLPGEARRHAYQAAAAAAEEARAQVAATERRVLAEALTAYTAATQGYRAWLANRAARAGAESAARLAVRAFELGEGTLSDTLLARRTALEAVFAETAARLDATEAHARLLVDAHRLWDFDDEPAP